MNLQSIKAWARRNRSSIATGGTVSILVVGAGIFLISSLIDNKVVSRTQLYDVPILELKIDAVPAPLSGLLVDKLDAKRIVTGVMVENSLEARPQSGLDDAEVVFEAIAEGGITRFAVFFQAQQPTKIGPVRSVRPHYVDWVLSFDAAIAHVGGSNQGLRDIRTYGAKDLDQFANGGTYYRSSDRYAPHNVYTSSQSLSTLEKAKGFKTSSFTGWEFDDEEALKTPKATKIKIDISSDLFEVDYKYDTARNQYLRSVGGAPHIDANTNKQIAVNNVVVMEVPYSIGGGYYNYDLVGSGTAFIFINGDYQKANWSRKSKKSSFAFKIGSKNVVFNRGQTWVTAVQAGAGVIKSL